MKHHRMLNPRLSSGNDTPTLNRGQSILTMAGQVPPLLWDVLKQHIPEAEHEEVRIAGLRLARCALRCAPQMRAARAADVFGCRDSGSCTQRPTLHAGEQVAHAVGRGILGSNAEAHQEACALNDLLGTVAERNAVAMQRMAVCATPQRQLLEAEILALLGQVKSVASTAEQPAPPRLPPNLPRRESGGASCVVTMARVRARGPQPGSASLPNTGSDCLHMTFTQ